MTGSSLLLPGFRRVTRRPAPRWLPPCILLLALLVGAAPRATALSGPEAASSLPGTWVPLLEPTTDLTRFMVHDHVHERMIMVCLSPAYETWQISLASPTAWTRIQPIGTPPPVRNGGTFTYDPVGDRIILFGGRENGPYFNDVWELSLGGVPKWTQLAPTGTPPSGRSNHSAMYDPLRERIIVFGGDVAEGVGYTNEIWGLELTDPPAWVYLPAVIPYPDIRSGQSAVYDPVRDRMLMYGGHPGHDEDLWTLDLSPQLAWHSFDLPAAPPSVAPSFPGFYDPATDRVFYSDGDNFVTMLALSPTMGWASYVVAGGASSQALAPIFDQPRYRLVVFDGGRLLALSVAPNNLEWTDITPGGWPAGRLLPSVVMDPPHRRVVMFGGRSAGSNGNTTYHGDTWTFSALPAAWTKIEGPGPPARYGSEAAWDAAARRMYIFGGISVSGYLSDTWVLDLSGATLAWTQLFPTGTLPGGRSEHNLAFDPVRRRLILFGGRSGGSNIKDTWTLDVDATTLQWQKLTPTGTTPDRRRAAAVYDPVMDRLLVIGGQKSDGTLARDVQGLSFSGTPAWTPLTTASYLPATTEPWTAVHDTRRHQMFLKADGLSVTLGLNPVAGSQIFPSGSIPPATSVAVYDSLLDWVVVPTRQNHAEAYALRWSTSVDVADATPAAAWLSLVRPNPASRAAWIRCALPAAAAMDLAVFDVLGRHVRTLRAGQVEAGTHDIAWDLADASGRRVDPGIYFARLTVAGRAFTRRVAVVE